MTSIFKRLLIPGFLRRLDAYLLVRNPVLWRTQVHFVLFYALLGAVALFLAGFYADVSAIHLQVAPIKPIEMGEDAQYKYALATVLLACFPWFYRLYQAGYPFYKAKDTLLTLLVYTVCFWVLLGITAPAYRLGTIYRTAWQWMDEGDLQRFEQSGVYPHGFVLLESDTVYKPQEDSFYVVREKLFNEIWKNEAPFLREMYTDKGDKKVANADSLRNLEKPNTTIRKYLGDRFHESLFRYKQYEDNLYYRSYLPHLTYSSYILHPDNFKVFDYTYSSERSKLSFLSYILDMLNLQ